MSTDERKTIEDLRAALFATIDGVRNKTITVDEARAVSELSKQLIDSAKVEVDFMRLADKKSAPFLTPSSVRQIAHDTASQPTSNGSVHSPEPGRTVHRMGDD